MICDVQSLCSCPRLKQRPLVVAVGRWSNWIWTDAGTNASVLNQPSKSTAGYWGPGQPEYAANCEPHAPHLQSAHAHAHAHLQSGLNTAPSAPHIRTVPHSDRNSSFTGTAPVFESGAANFLAVQRNTGYFFDVSGSEVMGS